ncbi:hypothetical protein [Methylobacterium sp. J-092]|uniref:hypothetical protein n=1 Tax=Methylobacterium sp. J-092 TaxID=2836667 RepID=UPI001FB9F2CB|nr:hypothetical protein [Methylobacterium sp. J-092]MCJ2009179.1 hypothetical protein [Methylobacterium sp. J-092]
MPPALSPDLPAAADPDRDRLDYLRERPLLRPWIVAEPVPTLVYVGADGRRVALTLDDRGLIELQLSIVQAHGARLRRLLESV